MKITWANIDTWYISKRGNFRKDLVTWTLVDRCVECGDPHFVQVSAFRKGKGKYCSPECQYKNQTGSGNGFYNKHHTEENKKIIGEKNASYTKPKGKLSPIYGKRHTIETIKQMSVDRKGVGFKYGIKYCWYETYQPQLEPYGVECRRSPDDLNMLEVRCYLHSCNKWYKPSKREVGYKISSINTGNGESNIYCSKECKNICPVYRKRTDHLIKNDLIRSGDIHHKMIGRDVQPELRQIVFERDDYTCYMCNIKGGDLNCHHIDPVKNNPIESADIDNCITLCVGCHKKVHQLAGCTTGELKSC